MGEVANIPHLRFPEFNEFWKESRIGKIYKDLRTGSTPSRAVRSYFKGDNLWITSGELKYNLIDKTFEQISDEAIRDTNLVLYDPGTLFIAITGLEAPGTRGKCAINALPATTNQSCLAFRKIDSVDTIFLFYWYRKNGKRFYFKYAQGTKQQSFNNKIVEEFQIFLPSKPEQQKIAAFLTAVDNKIEQLSKKQELLGEYKKGLMQKIFSQEIRFKADDGSEFPNWEEKKLGDVVELKHGYQFRSNDFTKSGLAIIKISNVIGASLNLDDLSFIDKERYSEFESFEIHNGDILMSLTGNIGRVVEVESLPFKAIQNYRVGKFVPVNSTLAKSFLKYLLITDMVFGRFGQLSNQSAQANFGKQDMGKIKVKFPSLPEQTKIANFLSSIDSKIEQVGKQLDESKQFKKALLQQMFV